MDTQDRWNEVKHQLEGEPLTLSPKMSATLQSSGNGFLFILARYKFALKMMANRKNLKVLDLGCNDGLGDLMILQNCHCEQVIGVDFDKDAIRWANENLKQDKLSFVQGNFMGMDIFPLGGDCVLSLDVIEHIPVEQEDIFFQTVCRNLKDDGSLILSGIIESKANEVKEAYEKAGFTLVERMTMKAWNCFIMKKDVE